MNTYIAWLYIPAANLERAIQFYNPVLNLSIVPQMLSGLRMGIFPSVDSHISGCILEAKNHRPSIERLLLYFNVEGRLDKAISQVEKYQGKILEAKHPIGKLGFRAIVQDSEGNRIALHST